MPESENKQQEQGYQLSESEEALMRLHISEEKPDLLPEDIAEYRVHLDAYAGPLDLLLYLVKRHEIDLHDIPMSLLVSQYMRYLQLIDHTDIDLAGDFLMMAATLLEIKSKMIVPTSLATDQAEEATAVIEEELSIDPRFALVQQLLAYRSFKEVSWQLQMREEEWLKRSEAHSYKGKIKIDVDTAPEVEVDLGDISMFDLQQAFERMLETVGHIGDHQVQYDDTPIALHAEDIADLLQRQLLIDESIASTGMSLRALFEGRENRSEMIGLFLATLELIRDHRIYLRVEEGATAGSPDAIYYVPTSAEAQQEDKDTMAQQSAVSTHVEGSNHGDYDWPDESAKIRAIRREKLRATLAAKAETEAAGKVFDLDAYKAKLLDEDVTDAVLEEEAWLIEEDLV